MPSANPRLILSRAALVANWRWFAAASGAAACGAAIKADGYGLGARATLDALAAAGCGEFFVAHWSEAAALGRLPDGARLAVLHGVQPGEMAVALASPARPVLTTAAQVAAWKAAGGRICDVMVDTGMNRLGLTVAEAASGLLDGLKLDTLHSHLACAEDPAHPHNAAQLAAFRAVVARVGPPRAALASSGGVMLGAAYQFGLTRIGLGLYGGQASRLLAPLQQVARIEARVIQVRDVAAGASVGYGASFTATAPTRVAVLGLGYGDGYTRGFGGTGCVYAGEARLPVIGRVSMDLITVDAGSVEVVEGDWLEVDYDLVTAAAATGMAQYELLTGLGARYTRIWR